jgi:hypothetical protein
MARSGEDASPDHRACIVALAEAMDRLIVVLQRYTDVDQVWLKLLVELAGDVHDLLEANACLDSIDLHDVCEEVRSLVADIGAHAAFRDDPNRNGQALDLCHAQADCARIIRNLCGPSNRSAVDVGSNSTGEN